ncbi:hypothetical protein SLPHG_CDS0002 [Salmonella phage Sephi301i]
MKAFAFVAAMWCMVIGHSGVTLAICVLILLGVFDE